VVAAHFALGAAGLLAIAATSGCAKSPTPGGVRLEQISDAFSAAGLRVDQFAPTDATHFNATRCLTGRVENIDTVVCEYPSTDALALGRKAGEQWAGNATTAAVLGNGRTLLAVADRAHSDPNGRSIHKITQAFSKTR
ncbi:MAG TPA: hypothetical protein VGH63_00060, partial [Polyangia bacterium]